MGENYLRSTLNTILSILKSITVVIVIIVFICYIALHYFVLPKRTLIKSYESEFLKVNVYKNTLRLIGDFPDKMVFAKSKDIFFSSEKLLYFTEILNNDSLGVTFEGSNIIRINAYENDTILQDVSCEYDLEFDTEPCSFYITGRRVQH